ncbi:Outer membrane protein TolC [Algoriphagus alkaliphilus]|uniref:Outer membrane protein TolC n=1 Tax=Algoriphagus alkaliphilus TaxID=279824 RepID=A0A1G5XFV2_9BACT|nr:TolC family protein [Algoriphagus alkaliphilus]MBA4299785.1 TolC family protein [Cyclobacterium sp.]SDA68816.1 Outer membrane protein TolC [Algoriphagus alkaliphilus]
MKNYLFTALVFLLTFSGMQAQEVAQLTLNESILYAIENNVTTKNARLETLISKATVKEKTALGLPQINGSFNVDYNPQIPVVFLPNQPPFGDPSNPSDVIPARFGVSYSSGLGVNMTQMIFDGSFFVGLRAAKTLTQLTDFDLVKAENDVIENVKKAYFGVLVNQERIRLAASNLARIDSLLKETKALNEAGFAEKIEVSRIQVQRNNTFSQMERSRTAWEISKEILKIQMGMPLTVDILIAETLQDLNPEEELNQLLALESEGRVELDQLKTQIELVQLDLKFNTSQYMPTIDFIGNARRTGAGNQMNTVFDKKNWFGSSLLGVSMNIPIFDGLSKSARIQKNKYTINQLENQRFFLNDNFKNEIFTAKSNLKNDLNLLDIQRENLDLAQEVFEIARIKYQEGVGSNLEVVNADSALIEAEINYLAAMYDGLISKVNLEKALGLLKANLNN